MFRPITRAMSDYAALSAMGMGGLCAMRGDNERPPVVPPLGTIRRVTLPAGG